MKHYLLNMTILLNTNTPEGRSTYNLIQILIYSDPRHISSILLAAAAGCDGTEGRPQHLRVGSVLRSVKRTPLRLRAVPALIEELPPLQDLGGREPPPGTARPHTSAATASTTSASAAAASTARPAFAPTAITTTAATAAPFAASAADRSN